MNCPQILLQYSPSSHFPCSTSYFFLPLDACSAWCPAPLSQFCEPSSSWTFPVQWQDSRSRSSTVMSSFLMSLCSPVIPECSLPALELIDWFDPCAASFCHTYRDFKRLVQVKFRYCLHWKKRCINDYRAAFICIVYIWSSVLSWLKLA